MQVIIFAIITFDRILYLLDGICNRYFITEFMSQNGTVKMYDGLNHRNPCCLAYDLIEGANGNNVPSMIRIMNFFDCLILRPFRGG
jgi:hypothetical protein